MKLTEPVGDVFARKPFDRARAVEAARNAWKRRPSRQTRDWARLIARAAATDASDIVRNVAIEALADVGTIADRRVLTLALDDESDLVRTEAVSALAKIVHRKAEKEIVRATQDRSTLVRRYAWLALADAIGDRAQAQLLEAAKKESQAEVGSGLRCSTLGIPKREATWSVMRQAVIHGLTLGLKTAFKKANPRTSVKNADGPWP